MRSRTGTRQLLEGKSGIEPGKPQRPQLPQLELPEVVARSGKVVHALELGHRDHLPREREAPPVIAAAQAPDVGRLGADEVAAMRAHVGEAPERSLLVAGQHQRLLHTPRQQLERQHGPAPENPLRPVHLLPAPREDLLPHLLERRRVPIERRRQGPGAGDVVVDHARSIAHPRGKVPSPESTATGCAVSARILATTGT